MHDVFETIKTCPGGFFEESERPGSRAEVKRWMLFQRAVSESRAAGTEEAAIARYKPDADADSGAIVDATEVWKEDIESRDKELRRQLEAFEQKHPGLAAAAAADAQPPRQQAEPTCSPPLVTKAAAGPPPAAFPSNGASATPLLVSSTPELEEEARKKKRPRDEEDGDSLEGPPREQQLRPARSSAKKMKRLSPRALAPAFSGEGTS